MAKRRNRKKAPLFYKDCKLCETGFSQAVKDIEDQDGETRSSAIRKLQNQMIEFAGLAERSITALRKIADRRLPKKDVFPKRENKTPEPIEIIEKNKTEKPLKPEPVENIEEKPSKEVSLIVEEQDKRMEAIKFLDAEMFCELDMFEPWPEEMISFIKRRVAKKYHPDSGGSDKAYKEFEHHLEAL